jgi:hypothetical protein
MAAPAILSKVPTCMLFDTAAEPMLSETQAQLGCA